MYELDGQYLQLDNKQKYTYFTISLVLNSLGNALAVSTNMGASPWTAAAANLVLINHWSIAIYLMLMTVTVAFLNIFLSHSFKIKRLIGNLFFGASFAYLVGVFVDYLTAWHVSTLPLPIRIILDISAIVMLAVGISIYQRINWILHPLDDLTSILRFNYLNGSAVLAQLANYSGATLIALFAFWQTKTVISLGLGTLVAFLIVGKTIDWSDRNVFKHLVHADVTGEFSE